MACRDKRLDGNINLPVIRDLYSNDTCTPMWDCVCPDFLMTSGGLCPIGYYCPEGSAKPTACDSGKYCATPGLSSPTGTFVFTQTNARMCILDGNVKDWTSLPMLELLTMASNMKDWERICVEWSGHPRPC